MNAQVIKKGRINQSLYQNLIAYWPMSETSGDRKDLVRSLTLTNNNSVGSTNGVGISVASSFVGTQSLSRPSETLIQLGDFDFTFAGWVYFTTTAGSPVIMTKYNTGQTQMYTYIESTVGPNIRFVLSAAANGSADTGIYATNFGIPPLNTWIFMVVWHDSINNQMGIAINNTTPNTAANSAGVYANGTAALRFGADDFGTSLNGNLQRWGYWNRVLTVSDRAALYNNGNGLAYPFTGQNI